MSDLLRVLDCEFCAPPVADPASPLQLVANRIITTYGDVLLVADRTPMTLGHLLAIPRDHHTGMASFVAGQSGATSALRTLTRRYRDAFGSCSVIEHGTGAAASTAGPCIDHAHWHLFPYNNELAPIVESDYEGSLRLVNSMAEFALGCAGADYLLYWDANGARVALLDTAAKLPQYARSVVARHLDASAMPYDWDWALRASDELLVQTLTAARAKFNSCDDTKAKNGENQSHGEIA